MLDTNKRTNQTHPSLLPLRMALVIAESGSPARPPQVTADEQRAIDLIERMKTGFSKPLPFTSWKDNSAPVVFNLQEVLGSYV